AMVEPIRRTMRVAAEHPVFHGHFPGNPIAPGVTLLEWVLHDVAQSLGRAPSTLRVRETKFFTPLAPAQLAELHYQILAERCSFDIHCAEIRIAHGILEWG